MSASKEELIGKALTHRQNLIDQGRAIADAKANARSIIGQANQKLSDAQAAQQQYEQKKADYHNQLGSHFDNALNNHNLTKVTSGSVTAVQTHVIVSVPEGVYQQAWEDMMNSGYRPVYFNGYEMTQQSYFRGLNTETFFNVLFIKDASVYWASYYGLDSQTYQNTFDQYVNAGYRLAHINSYLSGGQIRYAPIFVMESWPEWVAYHGLTVSDHQSRFNDLTTRGYRPVNVSTVHYNGATYFTALYDKQNVGFWETWSLMDSASFQRELDKHAVAGRMPSYLDACSIDRVPHFSAVWNYPPGFSSLRYDMDAATYHGEYLNMLSRQFVPKIIIGYQNGDNVNYGAMWQGPVSS